MKPGPKPLPRTDEERREDASATKRDERAYWWRRSAEVFGTHRQLKADVKAHKESMR